jgi:Fic family protein
MILEELLKEIDSLQSKIDAHGKMSLETLNKVNYKLRLDWNYHSNAIEGNALTKEETRSVMINNITVDGKPIKDVLEMKGHDQVVLDLLKIGKGELKLSEKRIQDIHKAIIHEDDIEQQQKIGKWKTVNNYLINYKGERFDFTAYNEVPEEMHKLINWLNTQIEWVQNKKNTALHPAQIAFEFHLKYVSIHPFHDGNGRTARIFTNLILISFGYPAIIIKVNEKTAYGQYLADIQSYGGKPDLYLQFMCKKLLASQTLVLKAIEGVDIDEADDLDKKIALLQKQLNTIESNNEVKEILNTATFFKIYDGWLSELIKKTAQIIQKFNPFFIGMQHRISATNLDLMHQFINENSDSIINEIRLKFEQDNNKLNNDFEFSINADYSSFTKGGVNAFDCRYSVRIKFEQLKYKIEYETFNQLGGKKIIQFTEKLLHQPLGESEMNNLVKAFGDNIFEYIAYQSKKNKII